MTTKAEALTVKCPKCNAKPNDPCVYVNSIWRWTYSQEMRSNVYSQIVEKGAPCKTVHNERRFAYDRPNTLRIRKQINKEYEENKRREAAEQIRKYQLQTGWMRAYRQFVSDEMIQLADWLNDNPGIFERPENA